MGNTRKRSSIPYFPKPTCVHQVIHFFLGLLRVILLEIIISGDSQRPHPRHSLHQGWTHPLTEAGKNVQPAFIVVIPNSPRQRSGHFPDKSTFHFFHSPSRNSKPTCRGRIPQGTGTGQFHRYFRDSPTPR